MSSTTTQLLKQLWKQCSAVFQLLSQGWGWVVSVDINLCQFLLWWRGERPSTDCVQWMSRSRDTACQRDSISSSGILQHKLWWPASAQGYITPYWSDWAPYTSSHCSLTTRKLSDHSQVALMVLGWEQTLVLESYSLLSTLHFKQQVFASWKL